MNKRRLKHHETTMLGRSSTGIQNFYRRKPAPTSLLKPGGQNGPVRITKKGKEIKHD